MNRKEAHRTIRRASNPLCCYHCMKRRIKCDGTKPRCEKCLRKGLDCPGYGIRYRFSYDRADVSHRPKPADIATSTSTSDVISSTAVRTLRWPDGTQTQLRVPTTPIIPSFPRCPTVLHEREPVAAQKVCSIGENTQDCHSTSQPPRCLELIDSPTRELFFHFSVNIAPVMVAVDGTTNGYRNILLPLALTDQLVREGVRVTALDFLASSRPTMRIRADRAMQVILGSLRTRACSDAGLVDISAWATTILLLTAEIITGGSDFPRIFEMLKHLATANITTAPRTDLHIFLAGQTQMMTFFAQPLVQETPDRLRVACHSEYTVDSILGDVHLQPSLSQEFEIYKTAIRSACDIYILRATMDPCYDDTIPQLDQLQVLCEPVQPTTPGQHILVWVYFIAAAESSTPKHREFFVGRLRNLHESTKFQNIPVALAALEKIWKVRSERRWTEALSELAPIFII